jgi:hypothetical protein
MKFKQFLKESSSAEVLRWFSEYIRMIAPINGESISYKDFVDEGGDNTGFEFDLGHSDGKDMIETKGIEEIFIDFAHEDFRIPLNSSAWNKCGFGILIQNAKVHDFGSMPNVEYLAFEKTKIYSFDDANSDDLSRVGSIYFTSTDVECGMINLIKSKKFSSLREVTCNNSGDLKKACVIITRHLKFGRDVADCIDELIEAGLKQYAKL